MTSNVISLQTARELIGSGSIDGKRLPLIAFMDAQQAEIERLTAALAACQTYDYRTLADEVERSNADLASSREQLADLAKRWGAVVDDRERLRKLIHDTGVAFTGGNEYCSACVRVYNALAADQGWAKFPAETGAKHGD